MFKIDCPPDSAIGAFLDLESNVWLDEDGFKHNDLKEFGFTARQRETILLNIARFPSDGYCCIPNNKNEMVEIYWEKS